MRIFNFETKPVTNQMLGSLLFIVNGIMSVAMMIVAKKLKINFGIEPSALVFIRFLFVLLFLLPLMVRDKFAFLVVSPITVMRDIISGFAIFIWYHFGSRIEVNNVTTLSFLTPVFVIIMNSVLNKVVPTKSLFVSVLFCFAGVVVVAGFKLKDFNLSYLMILLVCVIRATVAILSKIASQTNSFSRMLYSNALVGATMSGIVFFVQNDNLSIITLATLPYIALMTFFYAIYFTTYVYSAKISNLNLIQPFDFLRIVFSAILSFIFLSEKITASTFFGSCLIVTGVFIGMYKSKEA